MSSTSVQCNVGQAKKDNQRSASHTKLQIDLKQNHTGQSHEGIFVSMSVQKSSIYSIHLYLKSLNKWRWWEVKYSTANQKSKQNSESSHDIILMAMFTRTWVDSASDKSEQLSYFISNWENSQTLSESCTEYSYCDQLSGNDVELK